MIKSLVFYELYKHILATNIFVHCSQVCNILYCKHQYRIKGMVFNDTFNNISVTSWRSVFLVEETGVPWKNHWPVASHWQTLSHNAVNIEYTSPWVGFDLTMLVEIDTDCIHVGSCKSNYHTIITTTAPVHINISDNTTKTCTVLTLLIFRTL